VPNPIFDSDRFRRDLPEARDLEKAVLAKFANSDDARNLAGTALLDVTLFNQTWPPSKYWQEVFESASKVGSLERLVDAIEQTLRPEPQDPHVRNAIKRVREVEQAGGSLSPLRLLLSGPRPFLGRKKLRDILPELLNWKSDASILVVRGPEDSGRTETQFLIGENNDDKIAYLDQDLPLESTLRYIWKMAGVAGEAPKLGSGALTTESATFIDFWSDVKSALEDSGKRLWILFDDLDKGPGRVDVRYLADVLAIRLKDATFQRRIRLVLLGYPDAELPAKVGASFVRNDTTEQIDESHVRAFVDFCAKAAGKNFDDTWVQTKATDLCALANANVSAGQSYLGALNAQLKEWYRTL
jgi:hypothetical protein